MKQGFRVGRRVGRVHGPRRRTAAGRLLVASAAAAVAANSAARAAVYVFDPGGQSPPTTASDGSGNFDPTTGNFYNVSGGLVGAFGNTSSDTALFGVGGTAGTVTVGTVTAGALQFNATIGSYVLNGGTITLGAPGTPGVISLNAASGSLTPTINSVLAGTSGLLVQGNNVQNNSQGLSTLTLGGANTYTGVTNISGGVAVSVSNLAAGGNFGNTTGIVLNGTVGTLPTSATAVATAGLANEGAQLIYTGTGTATTGLTVGLTLGGNILDTINVSNASAVLNVAGPVTVAAAPVSGVQTGGLFSKQGAGTLGFTNAANTFNFLFVSSGTVNLGTGTGAAQTDTINNAGGGNNLVVGYTNLTPAGASAANPNVATLNILAGATVNPVGQGVSLGNSNLSSSSTAPNNELFVLNVAGTLVNNNTLSTFSGAVGTNNVAVINVQTGGLITAPNVKFSTAALTATSTNTGTTVLNVSGGTFNVTAPNGSASDSLVRQAPGTVFVNLSGVTGVFNAGTGINVTSAAGQTSAINQSGGTFNVVGNLGFNSGLGTYTLGGGTLAVNAVGTAGTPTAGSGFVFNGGTLQAKQASAAFFAVPTGTGMIGAQIGAGGATIDTQAFSVATAQVFSSNVSGGTDGGLTKIGSGTLTLSGASTYTGTTTIGGGRLAVTGSLAGPVAVTTGTLDGTGRVGPVTVGAGTGGVVTNGNGAVATLTMNALTFLGPANDTVVIAGSAPAVPGQVVTNALTTPTTGTVALNVSLGSGSLTLGTYDLIQYGTLAGGGVGGFTLNPNSFTLGNNQTATLGTSGNYVVLIVSGAVDQFTGVNGNDFSTNATGNFRSTANGSAINFANGDAVLFDDTATAASTALNLGTAVAPASTTFNNSSLAYTVNSTGGFGIGGAGPLVKNGTAALTVNTANTYTGGTTLNAGTLNLGNAAALGTGTLTVNGGTIDNTTGAALTLAGTPVAINGSFTFAGSNPLSTGTSAVSVSGSPTVTVAAATLTVPVGITGSGSLTVTGTPGAALVLTGLSSYTGGTTVNGAALNLSNGGGTGAIRGPLTVNAGGTVNATAQDALGYNANVAVTTLTVNGGTFNFAVPAPTAANPNTTGNEGFITNVVLSGGQITSTASPTATGAAGIPGQFNFSPGFGITTLASGATSTFSTGVQVRNGAALAITTAAGSVANAGPDLEIDGPINQLGGAGSINKLGAGTLTVTDTFGGTAAGVSNYSGGTTVTAGTLRANDVTGGVTAVLGTGTTAVLTGGTLGGNGATGGPVVVAGRITAGATAATTGTLTTGAETWNGSGGYVAKVAGSSNDTLVMSGLTINAVGGTPFTVFLNGSSGAALTTGGIVLAVVNNGTPGYIQAAINANALVLSTTGVSAPSGTVPALEEIDVGGNDELVAFATTAAPEPTSLVMLAVASVPLVLGRRRAARRPAAAER